MVHPRPLPAQTICWKCQWRISNQYRGFAQKTWRNGTTAEAVSSRPRRALHVSRPIQRPSTASSSQTTTPPLRPALLDTIPPAKLGIRSQLTQWQTEFGGPGDVTLSAFGNHPVHGAMANNLSKLSSSSKADEERDMDGEAIDEDDADDLFTIGLFLKPGDVVELSQPGREPVLAVFVQQLDMGSQFFSINGRWCHSRLTSITFAMPGCIDPALLQPMIPYMPTELSSVALEDPVHVPRELGAPVQAVLHRLTEEAERIYRTNAPVLDTAYSVLAHASRTHLMTLPQIAKTLLAKTDPSWTPSPAALLAVRKALNHNRFRFRSDVRSQRLTNVFAIRPRNDVEVVETVQEWIREYNEYTASLVNDFVFKRKRSHGAARVAEFIDKARRLIMISREHRDPNMGCVGPSRSISRLNDQQSCLRPFLQEAFTDADRQIINFLQAWVLTAQFKAMPNLHSACTAILRATGLYEAKHIRNTTDHHVAMDRTTGHLFLQEIGVITPHENRAIYDEHLMLPTVGLTRNLELLTTKAEMTRQNPDFRDSMADLRRDWGSATVFCIDSAHTKEVDDGVSIERIEGTDSEFWIHVHIANPTAFFDKTHVLSGLAAHMTESVYIPERAFPMLPKWTAQDYFSLDSNRPVITFSSRVDASGNLVESKIQHGIIRNVVSMTPSEVSACLDEEHRGTRTSLVVGDGLPTNTPARTPPKLTSRQLQDLRDMYTVAKARWSVRKAAGGVQSNLGSSDVQVYESTRQAGLAWMPPSLDRARFIHGDPTIQIVCRRPDVATFFPAETHSENLVAEMMVLACTSAASWCAERNVPVMFRGTVEVPSGDLSFEQFKKQVVTPYLEKHGRLSSVLESKYLMAIGRTVTHSSPVPHKHLGVPAYVKVTSPLRRFSDMIAHWQIEAAIRHEARSGNKLTSTVISTEARPVLPFSLRQIQESIITLTPREKMISAIKQGSAHYWTVQAYHRAFYYGEAPLPATFRVSIKTTAMQQQQRLVGNVGYMINEMIRVKVQDVPDIVLQQGDEWLVKIHSIDIWRGEILVAPLELLYRDADLP